MRGSGFRTGSIAAACGRGWLLSACLLLVACAPEARAPNVLLVTIDTLRADRLSSYGHARETSPFLDGWADAGVRFERAYATSSWTAPSVASIMTSFEPSVHGIEHGHLDNRVIVKQEVIPDSVELWPELMREVGYRTYGVTANTHLYGRFGFDQGFDRYECVGFLDAEKVVEVVERWRDEIANGEGPWFLWVHLFDPHARYKPREPWIGRFYPRYQTELRPIRGVVIPDSYRNLGVERGTRSFRLVNALYDGEIAYTDRAIQKIAETVGVSEGDFVAVTSDHGEEFLEHDRFGHGKTLYEEVIRVPLILRLPNARHAGSVVDAPVSLIDLLPTALDVVGAEPPPELQGRSLLPLLDGRGMEERAVVSSLARFEALGMDSVTRGRWKYIRHRVEKDQRMLFDVESDPGETRNRIESDPDTARELAAILDAHLERSRERSVTPAEVDLTDDEFDQLEALGYVRQQ